MRLIASWLFPVLLLLLGLALYMPGIGRLDLWDLQEMRLAEAAREMLATGEYYRLQVNFKPTWDLGPLAVWWHALGIQAFGLNEVAIRFPNACMACLALLSVFFVGRRLHEGDFGFIWALLAFCPLGVYALMRTGLAEPAYGFFTFLAVSGLAFSSDKRLRGGAPGLAAMAGFFLGLAVLADGVVALLVVGLLVLFVWLLNGGRPLFAGSDVVILVLATSLTTILWFGYEWAANGPEFLQGLFNGPTFRLGTDEPGRTPLLPTRLLLLGLGLFPTAWLAVGPLIRYREKDPADFRKWMMVLVWILLAQLVLFPNMSLSVVATVAYPLGYLATLFIVQPVRRTAFGGRGLWASVMSVMFLLGLSSFLLPVLLAAQTPWLWKRLATGGYLPGEPWSGYEGLAGWVLLLAAVPVFRFGRAQQPIQATLVTALALLLFGGLSYPFLGRGIQQMVQGPYPRLFAQTAGHHGYAAAITFKSYAPLFYGQRKPGLPCNGMADSCFLKRLVAQPVYKVVPAWSFGSGKHLAGFEEIDRAGPYVLFKRFEPYGNQ